jgi:transposase
MPKGTPVTQKIRNEIFNAWTSGGLKQTDIAELFDLGGSTVSRIIAEESGLKPRPKKRAELKNRRNISVAATFEDHAMITEYAKEHNMAMHEALHAVLHDNNTVDIIKREVEIMMKAAKTEVAVIKKKWWHL